MLKAYLVIIKLTNKTMWCYVLVAPVGALYRGFLCNVHFEPRNRLLTPSAPDDRQECYRYGHITRQGLFHLLAMCQFSTLELLVVMDIWNLTPKGKITSFWANYDILCLSYISLACLMLSQNITTVIFTSKFKNLKGTSSSHNITKVR